MLITKTVKMKWHPNNKNLYESKGYIFTKWKEEFEVKVEDLTDGSSSVFVDIECDGCEKLLENIRWQSYKWYVKEDGKYYCRKCSTSLFNKNSLKKIKGKSFYQWCYDNLSKELADYILSRWDYELNIDINGNKLTPINISYGSKGLNNKGYWFKCLDNVEHESEQKNLNNFTRDCENTGNINCKQCEASPFPQRHLIKKDKLGKEVIYVVCPNCGYEKETIISNLGSNRFHCPRCSDGLPYPEKFLFSFLEQLLNKSFQKQLTKTTFKWCNKYKYDNYIENINCIIETHGLQHYRENTNWIMSLSEIQENDFDKEWLARLNKIKNYIILDCRKSELEWIKNSIMKSRLPILLGFKEEDIDWIECDRYALLSIVKEVCDLWSRGIKNTSKIANKLKLNISTVIKYLKRGVKQGWCDYINVHNKKVICLTTGEVFDIISATEKYNIKSVSISANCRRENKYAGIHPETGNNLVWMYYDKYLIDNQSLEWQQESINNEKMKIICLNTGETFNSQVDANIKYNIKRSNISNCCKGKQISAGKHPETKEPLFWMYYNEYIDKNKIEGWLENYINSRYKNNYNKVICLTTEEIFNSQKEACKKYNINNSDMSMCCNNKRDFAGKHPETGEKLKWMFLHKVLI